MLVSLQLTFISLPLFMTLCVCFGKDLEMSVWDMVGRFLTFSLGFNLVVPAAQHMAALWTAQDYFWPVCLSSGVIGALVATFILRRIYK